MTLSHEYLGSHRLPLPSLALSAQFEVQPLEPKGNDGASRLLSWNLIRYRLAGFLSFFLLVIKGDGKYYRSSQV